MTRQRPATPAAPAPAGGRRPAGGGTSRPVPRSTTALVAATSTVAAGMFLTALPLKSVFTDWTWLLVSILCGLPYLAVVCGLRYRGGVRWWHSLVGLAASVLMLLWVFVPGHLYYGVLPTGSTGTDIGDLIDHARQIMQAEHAPVTSTASLRLLVAAALVGLLCLTDVLGVLLRQPLLAAAPLLEVLAVASATSSNAANPFCFAGAAIGFLLILLAGTRLQDLAWGPSVDGSAGRLGGGRRMAVTGIIAALIIPFFMPTLPTNVLARLTHHNGGTGGNGSGPRRVAFNGLASLRGSLLQPTPTTVLQMQVGQGDDPFYVRMQVDDQFTNDGWQPAGDSLGSAAPESLSSGEYTIQPEQAPPQSQRTFDITATFRIAGGLDAQNLPILANPKSMQIDGGNWDSLTGTARYGNGNLRANLQYQESVVQAAPTVDQLRSAPDWVSTDNRLTARYLGLPQQPSQVVALAQQLTAGKTNAYDKALAISNYFTDGTHGFVYSLNPPASDGTNALVSFLNNKIGFCQQYAAAAAVLMREAQLPARVVVGFTHRQPDNRGVITVSTSDAHAWVEVYFSGIGWIPFDPTPLGGADAGRVVPLQWAAHPNQSTSTTAEPTANKGPSGVSSAHTSTAPVAGGAGGSAISPLVWEIGGPIAGLLVLLTLLIWGPRMVRRRQRRNRLDRARSTGNPELLWLELAATATDRNALWPRTMTVGQVPAWLGRHGVDERGQAAVQAVAATVARDRFSAARVTTMPPDSVRALDLALGRWARRTDRRLSLVNRWLPKSLLRRPPRWQR